MRRLFLHIFLSSTVLFSYAQQKTPQIEWEKTFGGPGWDVGRSVLVLPDGGFIVVGYFYTESAKGDAWIIKLDVQGDLVWEKKFGGKSSDVVVSITRAFSGGFAIAGYTSSKGAGADDGWVVKLDNQGEIEWEKTFGSHGEERINAIISTPDSGYVLTGYNKSVGKRNGKAWILKLDQHGTLEWEKTYGGDSGGGIPTEVGNAILSMDGYYYVAAHTRNFGAGDEDMWVLKLDSEGNKIWDKTFGGVEEEKAFKIIVGQDGNIIVAGYNESKGSGNDDVWLLCIDGDGKLLWDETYGGHSNDQASTMYQDENGGFVIAGHSHSKGPVNSGLWVLKTNQERKIEWELTFDGFSSYDRIHTLQATPDGGFVAVGEIWSKGEGKSDIYVVKIEGNLMKSIDWYVTEKITPWIQRGEFEKSEDYQERISSENPEYDRVRAKYVKEATNYYGTKQIRLADAELGKYNADHELFFIHFQNFDAIEVEVPINDAQLFKQNWKYVEFENPIYDLKDNQLILAKVEMVINGITYTFNYPESKDADLRFEMTGESDRSKVTGYRGSGDPLKGLNVSKAGSIKVGKYYALIIGIDDYKGQWSPLANAVGDARAVEKLLRSKYQFNHIKTLYNEASTRANIIDAFLWLVENVKENDNVFIYYSGHGEYEKKLNKGFWVPVDAQTSSISIYISNSDIQTFLGSINSKHTLMVSDACFSGDIFRGKTSSVPFENAEKYYQKVYSLKSCQAISSGGIEPVMDGGRDGHSVFAYYFLKALNDNQESYLDASRLFDRIKVPIVNNSDQSPKFSPIKNTGDEGGQFVFIRR